MTLETGVTIPLDQDKGTKEQQRRLAGNVDADGNDILFCKSGFAKMRGSLIKQICHTRAKAKIILEQGMVKFALKL